MYGFLADLMVAVHVAYVGFVVVGELLILAGWVRGWGWVRNFWFRSAHLLAIGAVVVVELLGVRCPITLWEEAFRARAGQPVTGETFMSRMMHAILYFDAPVWVFTAFHLAAGAVILATFVFFPPRRPGSANLGLKWHPTRSNEDRAVRAELGRPAAPPPGPGRPGVDGAK